MDLESWVIELLDDIQAAAEKGENYDLHLESPVVKDIAKAYKDTCSVAIY